MMSIETLTANIEEQLDAIREAETIGDWQEIYRLGARISEMVREIEEQAWDAWGVEL
jgi:hypothetical protein